MRRLVADVESFLASGRDITITSLAVSIWTILHFFLTSKSICNVVSGVIALILVAKDVGDPQGSKTVNNFANLVPLKSYSIFCGKRFFVFFRVFA